MRMQKIGLVGLGGIFQKAYLPYLRGLSGIEWHLFTRNQEVLSSLATNLAGSQPYASLEELAAVDLDGVMIHAATQAHVELAKLFLERGIPVFMDKPLSEDYQEAVALYHLAQAKGTFLMAGFNRRFAPKVQSLKAQGDKRRILVEKNDVNRPGDLQFKLFDFFIHPLDTALFLLDDQPQAAAFAYHLEGGKLSQVSVTLQSDRSSVVTAMNLQSGSRREIIEVQTPQASLQLQNLDELTIYQENRETKDGFGSWETTLYKRGFESMVDAYLEALKKGQNPVDPESSLLSHWICEQIKVAGQSSGTLDLHVPIK